MQTMEKKKEMSELRRQELMQLNGLKEERWRQKRDQQYVTSELAHQAEQTMVRQER